MAIVTSATLAARLGVADSSKVAGAVAMGEAQACAYIGCEQLDLTSQSERIRPPRDRDSIEITKGPLTVLTSLSVDGTEVDLADLTSSYWSVGLYDLTAKFACGKTVAVAYQSGWANEAALPANVLEAVLLAGVQSYSVDLTAGGLVRTAESLGDWSISYSQLQTSSSSSTVTSLPLSATSLLTKYRRPIAV